MVITSLPDGRFVDVNNSFLRLIESSRQDVIGHTSSELNIYRNQNDRDKIWRILFDKGKFENYEMTWQTKNGKVITVNSSSEEIILNGRNHALFIIMDITARKNAEEALKESEQRLRRLYESGIVGVMYWNMKGEITDANDKFLEMVGYSREDLATGRIDWTNMTPEEYRNLDERSMAELKTEGVNAKPFEKEYIRKDGTRIQIIIAGAMLDEARFNGVAIVLDITERKVIENELKKERDFTAAVLDNTAALTVVLDRQGRITRFNRACELITGYSSREVMGRIFWEFLIPPEDLDGVKETWLTLTKGDLPNKHENCWRTKDGSNRLISWSNTGLLSTEGEVEYVVASGIDVTDSRKAEAEIAHLASFPELNPSPILELSSNGDVLYANPIAQKRLPLLTQGLQHDFFVEFINTAQKSETKSAVKDINTGDYWYEETMTYVPSTQTYRLYGREITIRKKFEEELRKSTVDLEASNKELEAFSYSVSHDLRAPLRSITGFSTVLLEDYADELDKEGKSYLKKISDAGELMGQLMDDLLKLSRVTRNDLSIQRLDLSDMAHAIVDELRQNEPHRKVKITIAPDMTANGDKNLLGLVLQNLLGNAWKYSSKTARPRIEMGTIERNGKQAYFVRDNGVGFDMTYANKLFQPFQRLHKATEFAGTGIGLATVQRIIKRHGGEVWAEGKVGEGATFYFTLN